MPLNFPEEIRQRIFTSHCKNRDIEFNIAISFAGFCVLMFSSVGYILLLLGLENHKNLLQTPLWEIFLVFYDYSSLFANKVLTILLEMTMAIGNAVQRGSQVYVYNEKNQQIFTQNAGSGPQDGLKGYTNTTVNVRRGLMIYTYNEKGNQVSSTFAN